MFCSWFVREVSALRQHPCHDGRAYFAAGCELCGVCIELSAGSARDGILGAARIVNGAADPVVVYRRVERD